LMYGYGSTLSVLAAALALGAWPALGGAQPAFGDDSSEWALDGECDDPRFTGEGMARVLVAVDRYADATDCRALFDAGKIHLRNGDATVPGGPIDFGADTGEWVFDGECDDPRFVGDGMAETLVEADRLADATDCRALFEQGRIELRADGGHKKHGGNAQAVALQTGIVVRGALEIGDAVLEAGEYCDYYTFRGRPGAMAVVMLTTADFDPYLIVRAPSGDQLDNDDYEGDESRSVVTFPMRESGTYTIGVTSYDSAETGTYSVLVELEAGARALPKPLEGEIGVRLDRPAPGEQVAAIL
ncbi:MAG TPA: hypothetical protein VLD39_13535, partial [Gammaproteobacteria bacterium]|nr:hypothetical protein [Gammaproteobacteria bacterium]